MAKKSSSSVAFAGVDFAIVLVVVAVVVMVVAVTGLVVFKVVPKISSSALDSYHINHITSYHIKQ